MLRTSVFAARRGSARVQLAQADKACRHIAHVGTCSVCQRTQLAKWRAQLAQVAR